MGAFDDLIPKGGAKAKAAPALAKREGGSFDDLIPAGGAQRAKPRPAANDTAFARMISGRSAPAAKPSLFRMDSDFADRSGVGFGERLWASAKDMFGGHDSAAEYLAQKAGGTVDRDEQGDPIVVLKDGTRYRVNDQGFDTTDLANISGNVAASYVPASWAMRLGRARQLGVVGRTALQAGAAAATDAAEQATVNEGRVDAGRVALAGVGGGAGEVVGTGLAQGSRAAARVIGRSDATRRAREVLRRSGAPLTRENVAGLSRRVGELDAGADERALLGQQEYGLQYTRGQRAMEPATKFRELSREELLRQSPGGGAALREAERQNVDRVGDALGNIGERLGGRPGATPAELAQGAAGRLRDQADDLSGRISEAYKRAGEGGRTAIVTDAVAALPDRLRNAVRDFDVDPRVAPATARTLEQIRTSTAQLPAAAPGGRVSGVTLKALETQRRILNHNIQAAANPADRAAMYALKREFDGWLDESIDTSLAKGDAASLQALKEARQLRAEFGRRFEGKADTDRFIGGLLDGSKTPEELVNIALGAGQVSKAGGARFVQRLKDAAGNDPEVVGQLRAAHFLRLTHDAKGDPLTFGQIVSNVRRTENSNSSIVSALYSPQEWGEIKRLAGALEPLVAKGDFARTSGSAERMARMFFDKLGGNTVGVRTVKEAIDAVRANRALNAPLKLKAPAHPAVSALGSSGKVLRDAPLELDITGGRVGTPDELAADAALVRGAFGR